MSRRFRLDPDADYRIICAGTADADPANIDEAKQATHDALIDDLGDRRLGPVFWRILPARQGIDHLRSLNWPDTEIFRYLAKNPGGRLIIAGAQAILPEGEESER